VGFSMGMYDITDDVTCRKQQQVFEKSKLGARIPGLSCQAMLSHWLSCGVMRGV
jgi:hypothetical protein